MTIFMYMCTQSCVHSCLHVSQSEWQSALEVIEAESTERRKKEKNTIMGNLSVVECVYADSYILCKS